VRAVHSHECRAGAQKLLERRYNWRGYGPAPLPPVSHPERRTFTASKDERVLGTLTVSLDGPDGLNCETLFGAEVATLRAASARVCEFTRLAVDAGRQESAHVLQALFEAAFAVAHSEHGADTLLIEVNPRHVRYYQRRFGARLLTAPRHHPQIDAPSALMQLNLAAQTAPAAPV
jgi:hypothetical protein